MSLSCGSSSGDGLDSPALGSCNGSASDALQRAGGSAGAAAAAAAGKLPSARQQQTASSRRRMVSIYAEPFDEDASPHQQQRDQQAAAHLATKPHTSQASPSPPPAASAAADTAAASSLGVPIGERVWCDDCGPGVRRQSLLVEGFALLTMALWCGWIHALLLLALASIFSRAALLLLLGLSATLLLPAPRLAWPAAMNSRILHAWRRYFRLSVVFDEPLDLTKRYVIAEYPHGVFPLSQLICVSLTHIWPGHPIFFLAANSVFRVPGWRHVITWLGAVPATASDFRRVLQAGSVGLVPGGIAEMFMVEPDREVIKLRDRKGFVRIAVECGAPLLPCYHFGNSRLFGWAPKAWEAAARRHRIALGWLTGRWGLPLPLPNRVLLMMAVGAPVQVRKTDPHADPAGFAAAVDEAHAALVEAMQQLYERHCTEYGWAERPLVIK